MKLDSLKLSRKNPRSSENDLASISITSGILNFVNVNGKTTTQIYNLEQLNFLITKLFFIINNQNYCGIPASTIVYS